MYRSKKAINRKDNFVAGDAVIPLPSVKIEGWEAPADMLDAVLRDSFLGKTCVLERVDAAPARSEGVGQRVSLDGSLVAQSPVDLDVLGRRGQLDESIAERVRARRVRQTHGAH